jgi:hypothetical protein
LLSSTAQTPGVIFKEQLDCNRRVLFFPFGFACKISLLVFFPATRSNHYSIATCFVTFCFEKMTPHPLPVGERVRVRGKIQIYPIILNP